MKKTYVESWFVECQPGSPMMTKLTKPIASLSDTPVVILQSEVITHNYILFEVMNREDYLKYNVSLEMKNEYQEKIDELNNQIKRLQDELKSKNGNISTLNYFSEKMEEQVKKIHYAVELIGELSYYVSSEDNKIHYLLADTFEIDETMYKNLSELYRLASWNDMIIGKVEE